MNNLGENHEIFSKLNKKVIGVFEIETPISLWINEIRILGAK